MGRDKHGKRGDRRKNHQLTEEIVAAESVILDKDHQAGLYKKAWEAEKILVDMHKKNAERWKQKAGTFALLFWITLGSWLAFIVYMIGGK